MHILMQLRILTVTVSNLTEVTVNSLKYMTRLFIYYFLNVYIYCWTHGVIIIDFNTENVTNEYLLDIFVTSHIRVVSPDH